MVAYSDTILTDTEGDINSGTAIEMNCIDIQYTMGISVQAPQQPGKSVTVLTHSSLLAVGDFIGFANPIITITGYIEVDSDVANTVTMRLLQQMSKSGNKLTLTDKYDTDASDYRISGLTGIFPNETVTTISCIAKGLQVGTSQMLVKEGRVIKYVLTLQEVA